MELISFAAWGRDLAAKKGTIMSVEVMNLVFKSPVDLSPAQHWTLLVLADFADSGGRNSWPATATIAARARLGLRTVKRALADLRNKGLIITQAPANTQHKSTTYALNLTLLQRGQNGTGASAAPGPALPGTGATGAWNPSQSPSPSPCATAPKDERVQDRARAPLDPDQIPADLLTKALSDGWTATKARREWERFAYHHLERGTQPVPHKATGTVTWARHWATWRTNTQRFEDRDHDRPTPAHPPTRRGASPSCGKPRSVHGGAASDGFLRFFTHGASRQGQSGPLGGQAKVGPADGRRTLDLSARDLRGGHGPS